MAYPDGGLPVRERVIEAIRADLAAIASPGFHHTMKEVLVYSGQPIVYGTAVGPFALVVPGNDTPNDQTSGMIRHTLDVDIFVGLRVMPGSDAWKTELGWLLADVGLKLEQDKQLTGTAAYNEPAGEELYEAETTKPLALALRRYRVEYRHAWDDPSVVT